MKRELMGREVVVAITKGKLDFGPREQIFYGEFDGTAANGFWSGLSESNAAVPRRQFPGEAAGLEQSIWTVVYLVKACGE